MPEVNRNNNNGFRAASTLTQASRLMSQNSQAMIFL